MTVTDQLIYEGAFVSKSEFVYVCRLGNLNNRGKKVMMGWQRLEGMRKVMEESVGSEGAINRGKKVGMWAAEDGVAEDEGDGRG